MNGTPKKNQIKRQNKLENENLCSKHQPISQALLADQPKLDIFQSENM